MATHLVVAGIPAPYAATTLDAVGFQQWNHVMYSLFDALAVGCRPAPRPPYGWFVLPRWRDQVVNHDPYGDADPGVDVDGPAVDLGGGGRLLIFSASGVGAYTIDVATLADAVAAAGDRLEAVRSFDPLLADVPLCAGVAAEPDGWDGANTAYFDAARAWLTTFMPISISDGTTCYHPT